MHCYAKPQLPVLRNPLVLLSKSLLDLYRALDRIDHTWKLGQHTIARCVGYASPVLSDELVHNLTMSRKGPHGPHFVLPHKTRIARHIRREDGCELAFDRLGGFRHG